MGLRTRLGLGLTFGHLKLRVENVQTAMSWSTYECILLSHNTLICIIASVWNLVKGLSKAHYNDICLFMSTICNTKKVTCNIVDKLDKLCLTRPFDFGIHADSHQECSVRLDVCLCYLLLYATASCSICM